MIRIDKNEKQEFEIRHEETVRRLAPEGTLLLKKDGVLPLSSPCEIALYGNGARRTTIGGTGSGEVNARETFNIEESLEKAGFTITTKTWLDNYDQIYQETRKKWVKQIQNEAKEAHMHSMLYAMGKVMPEPEYYFPLDGKGDIAIYVLSRISGEGNDRTKTKGDLYLTETEKRQILALNDKYKEFILVLNIGGMIELEEANDVKNILLLGQLGATTGQVLADLLLGKSYPSGKLTMTWADIDSYPSAVGFDDLSDVVYRDEDRVGYRHFVFKKESVRYPFGFGLSYTDFSCQYKYRFENNKLHISTVVKNVGNNPGKEIIQIYASTPDRLKIKLIGFSKTDEIKAGSSQELDQEISYESLAEYNYETSGNLIQNGIYTIYAGISSFNLTPVVKINVKDDIKLDVLKKIDVSATEIEPFGYEYAQLVDTKVDVIEPNLSYIKTVRYEYGKHTIIDSSTKKVLDTLSEEELIQLCVGRHKDASPDSKPKTMVGNSGNAVAGSAGETNERLVYKGIPNLIMADGPAGLRIATEYIVVNNEIKIITGDIVKDSEFLTEEEMYYVKLMMGQPTDEEKKATHYFQYCTSLPIGSVIAQSFNPYIAEQFGDILGEEMNIYGVNLWLAPAMNIQRYPLCGRNFEYYSEDPLLTGKIAAGVSRGVQKHKGCGTTIKHFACNNQELNRSVNNSIVSEKALRDIYLKPFEIAVKEGHPVSLMTANNLINDIHACEKRDLINNILRDEWGFDGIVMTDWFVTNAGMASMFKGSRWGNANASGCVYGGNDVSMPGEENDVYNISQALKEGKISIDDVKECASRVIKLAKKLGE